MYIRRLITKRFSEFISFEYITSITEERRFGHLLPNAIFATNCTAEMISTRADRELFFALDIAKRSDLTEVNMIHCFKGKYHVIIKIHSTSIQQIEQLPSSCQLYSRCRTGPKAISPLKQVFTINLTSGVCSIEECASQNNRAKALPTTEAAKDFSLKLYVK